MSDGTGVGVLRMARKQFWGNCHLCGEYKKLSFEHVPPHAAFNNRPLVARAIDEVLEKGSVDNAKRQVFQRGAGAHTLCEKCNNDTGRWYGRDFVEWTYKGLQILTLADGTPSLHYTFHILPLRVIKQIVCMFFSVNSSGVLRNTKPELAKFVLDKQRKYLPDDVRIYAFYAVGSAMRQSPLWGKFKTSGTFRKSLFSEITFIPFGYVLGFDDPPDSALLDISFFARYRYDDYEPLHLRLPVLPVVSYFPGDYRTQKQIDKAVEENAQHARNRRSRS